MWQAGKITVDNKYHGDTGINVMRGHSHLANLFIMGVHGTRKEVLEKYLDWLREQYKSKNTQAYHELMNLVERVFNDMARQNLATNPPICIASPPPPKRNNKLKASSIRL